MNFKQRAVLLSILAFFVYALTSKGETPYNYFELLAQAFLKGNFYIYIKNNYSHLAELIPIGENKYYVPYAPMPALFLMPFLLIGINSQTLISHLLGALIVYLSTKIAFQILKNEKKALYIGLITAFGTTIWYLAIVGSSWYYGQLVGIFFLSLAVYLKLISKNYKYNILTGLFLGAAYLARPHMILSLPFFVFFNNKQSLKLHYKIKLKNILLILIGVLPALFFNFYYNFARFGVIWDAGYYRIPNILEEPWFSEGIFNIKYISRNLEAIFLYMPDKINKFPYLIPNFKGLALWIVMPSLFLLSVFNKKNVNLKNKLNLLSLLAILLIGMPILMHGTVGFTQFGYRFANDLLPFFVILLASSINKIKNKNLLIFVLLISVIINAWGVLTINSI